MEYQYCKTASSQVFTPEYPEGASSFTLIDAPAQASVNSTTGVITITALISVGVYEFVVSYLNETLTQESLYVKLFVNNCGKLSKTDFITCQGNEEPVFFQLTNEAGTTHTFAKFDGDDEITINSSGLITFTYSGTGVKGASITYKIGSTDYFVLISVTMIDCDPITNQQYVECPTNPVCIAWLNNKGGWDSYYFAQTKAYSVDQSDAIEYINYLEENRYATRGNVYEGIECLNNLIPLDHIDRIKSLRNSIQAYIMVPNDADGYDFTPIKVEQGKFTTYQTSQEFYSLSFKFIYAKALKIQTQ